MVFTEKFLLIILILTSAAECVIGISALNTAGGQRKLLMVIPVTEHMQDIEGILREALRTVSNSSLNCRIIMCSIDADSETLEICRRFSEENGIFELYTSESAEAFSCLL